MPDILFPDAPRADASEAGSAETANVKTAVKEAKAKIFIEFLPYDPPLTGGLSIEPDFIADGNVPLPGAE